jgi:hypothetical protein
MIPMNENPGQSITATGNLTTITIQVKKFGLPDVSIRAKVYQTVPLDFSSGFPLSDYVGQSDNVVAATSLTTSLESYTFYFPGLSVTGQWTVVFEYEDKVIHDQFNYAVFSIGLPSIYAGGTFLYYSEMFDTWYLVPGYDMVFSCTYCGRCILPESVVPSLNTIYGTYTMVGPEEVVDFTDSLEEACAAIFTVDAGGERNPQWDEVNLGEIPANGSPMTLYDLDTNCPLNGYYVICGEGCAVFHLTDGVIDNMFECTTTTTTAEVTTTTTTAAVTTTTTTAG